MTWTIEDSDKFYGVSNWGNGHFKISEDGKLAVTPSRSNQHCNIIIEDVIEEAKSQGLTFPIVIRFHDILRSQVRVLNKTFADIIDDADYEGKYHGVYPIKVNQMREVVEEIIDAGARFSFGLEAGSKPELLAVLAYNNTANALTVLNGYKDEDYLRLAFLGRQLGRKVIIVIEKFTEIHKVIKLSKETGVKPLIGLRSKMTVKGRGKWVSSSGEKAKFGLTTSELLKAIHLFEENDLLDCIKLFHFHIGSQVTDIRAIKEAIAEGSRLYCELAKLCPDMEYFDVGGGLGVDYDGTQSTNDSSINYSIEDYVSDIVYGLKQTCDLQNIAHPNIITESGRALTAHHSCVVTDVIGEINNSKVEFNIKKTTGEHILVSNMRELLGELEKSQNWQEAFHDALKLKEDALNAFKLGILTLEERAKIETCYWQTLKKVGKYIDLEEVPPEEKEEIEDILSSQYLCNFSVFQSAADSWAIDQILPVVPISRLDEEPEVNCSLVDITCDSDGKINNFMGPDGVKKTTRLHSLNEDPYYLGIFLTGAYQDVMGDMHNLFGRLNEVHVFAYDDDPKNFYIEEVIKGSSAETVLSTMQYNPQFMAFTVKKEVDSLVSKGKLAPRTGVSLVDFYENCLGSYTYLS